jgi:hypothetical protein
MKEQATAVLGRGLGSPDGTVGIEAPGPTGVGYATRLVKDGIEGKDGRTYHLSDGQAFLDNLKYHFRSCYTWVRDEKPPLIGRDA